MKILLVLGIVAGVLLFRLLRVYASIPWYARYWKKQAIKTPPEGSFTFVIIGDSVAQGIGTTRVSQSYVRRLGRAITVETGKKVHMVNLSVTGATVHAAIKSQLPQFKSLDYKPDIVLLEIGANDIKFFEAKKFEADFKKILSLLPKSAIVAEVPPFGGVKEPTVL